MSKKNKSFPLPLSRVVSSKKPEPRSGEEFLRQTVTPQTATRNMSEHRQQVVKPNMPVSRAHSPAPMPTVSTVTVASTTGMHRPARVMVDKIAQLGIHDAQVLQALEIVPRHLFVESGLATQAYNDVSLPIGYHQTISRPYTVARMIEVMRQRSDGKPVKKVLEIGTGCGYQAAVLAQLAHEVYSIERIKALHELARNNLRPLRIPNLRLHYGDGMIGLEVVAPFDGIIVAAAGLEIPQLLLKQLAVGGRLVVPVGRENQIMQVVERVDINRWEAQAVETCHFVPLRQGVI